MKMATEILQFSKNLQKKKVLKKKNPPLFRAVLLPPT
jgi:hypothetical protein